MSITWKAFSHRYLCFPTPKMLGLQKNKMKTPDDVGGRQENSMRCCCQTSVQYTAWNDVLAHGFRAMMHEAWRSLFSQWAHAALAGGWQQAGPLSPSSHLITSLHGHIYKAPFRGTSHGRWDFPWPYMTLLSSLPFCGECGVNMLASCNGLLCPLPLPVRRHPAE